MKYLIIGLGNPGVKYENTRHNIGFKILERLSENGFQTGRYADVSTLKFKGRNLIMIKPNTFMNCRSIQNFQFIAASTEYVQKY